MPKDYKPWTEAEEETLRDLAKRDMTIPQIAGALNRSRNSVANKAQSLGVRTKNPLHRYQDEDANVRESMEKRAFNPDFYEWLRPVEVSPPPKQNVTRNPAPFTIIGGDFHFGMEDPRACALLLSTVEALRPKRVILNGDTVDLLAVSRYPKDRRSGKTWELRDEVAAFHGFLRELHRIGDSWGIEILETEANHSGDGTAGRWWRYLNDRCPELLGHAEAEERLSYASWFFPKWSSIRLVSDVMVADDLLVLHGDMVRSHAAYTAKATREKWMNSVIVNHTHRMGFSPKTVTAHAGRPTSYVRAYENGCLCKLEVPYGVALDWQQGFAVVCEDKDAFGVEQVMIDNGRASIAALGKTLRA